MSLLQVAALERQEELAKVQIESLKKFDAATTETNGQMVRFTVAVAVMTLILLVSVFGSPWAK